MSELKESDIATCDQMHVEIVGVSRLGHLKRVVFDGYGDETKREWQACVARNEAGTITGFTTGFFPDGIVLATTENCAKALINHASKFSAPTPEVKFHVLSVRNPNIVTWALANKMRIVNQCMIMVWGTYTPLNTSAGVYLPSVSY